MFQDSQQDGVDALREAMQKAGRRSSIGQKRKYRRWYRALIEHAKNHPPAPGVYSELHHIRPRCAGGSDAPENIVQLTARQHIVAHDLLARAYGHRWGGLWGAANFMHRTRGIRVPSRIAAAARKEASLSLSQKLKGRRPSDETRKKLCEARKGWVITQEGRQRISDSKKGKPRPDLAERNRSLSGDRAPCFGRTGEKHPMFGKSHTEESRRKISQSQMGRPSYERTAEYRKAISEKNQKRDVIHIRNEALGRTEFGTRRELIGRCGLGPTALSNLILGKQKSTAGWRMLKIEAAT